MSLLGFHRHCLACNSSLNLSCSAENGKIKYSRNHLLLQQKSGSAPLTPQVIKCLKRYNLLRSRSIRGGNLVHLKTLRSRSIPVINSSLNRDNSITSIKIIRPHVITPVKVARKKTTLPKGRLALE